MIRKNLALILKGEITVKSAQEKATCGLGDYVAFSKGLDCIWTEVKPVRKHYTFR